MNTYQLFFVCVTVISITAIICYTVAFIATHDNVLKVVRQMNIYDYPKARKEESA